MTITTPEGYQFVLYENEVVTIDLFSSLFNTDGELKGSYSYAGKAPLLPNKRIIHYGDMLEKNTDGTLTNLQVRLGNIYWTNVNMQYQVNEQTEIEFSLTLNLSLINDKLKSTSLTAIPFPIHFLGTTELAIQNSMMASSYNVDWRNIPYVFAPVMAPKFTGDVKDTAATEGVIESDGYINGMRNENGQMIFNAPTRLKDGRLKYISVPFFYLNFVLKSLANYLGFSVGGEVMDDPETSKIVVFNSNQAFLPIGAVGMYITASDHLPDVTAAEFLKNIAQWGIYPLIRANTNELLFKFKRDYTKSQVKDWTGKVTNYEEVSSRAYGGFTIELENPIIQHDYSDMINHIFEGNAENSIEFKVSTLANAFDVGGHSSGWRWEVPFSNLEGNVLDPGFANLSNYVSVNDKRKFPILFLYYNGWREFYEYPLYPKLSAINDDTGKELFLTGVYNEYMKSFLLATEGAKAIKVDFLLNSVDVANWQDDDIINLRSRSGVNVSCLLKKLTIDVKSNTHQYNAQAEAIILKSAVYKSPPSGKEYIRIQITNIQVEHDGNNRTRRCDLLVERFNDKECSIPYTGNEIIPVDVMVNIKVRPQTEGEFSDEDGFTIRLAMNTQSILYTTILTRLYGDPQYYEIREFTIRENPRFYIV